VEGGLGNGIYTYGSLIKEKFLLGIKSLLRKWDIYIWSFDKRKTPLGN